jgi:hypothetical protein
MTSSHAGRSGRRNGPGRPTGVPGSHAYNPIPAADGTHVTTLRRRASNTP